MDAITLCSNVPPHDFNVSFILVGESEWHGRCWRGRKVREEIEKELELNHSPSCSWAHALPLRNILRVKNSLLPRDISCSGCKSSILFLCIYMNKKIPHTAMPSLWWPLILAHKDSAHCYTILQRAGGVFCFVYSFLAIFQGKEHQLRVSSRMLGNIMHLGMCLLVCGGISGSSGWP